MNRQRQHSVKFNAVMNTLLTASTFLVNIVAMPYVTRTLSVEGYGNVNFAQSLSGWFSALCLIGIPAYGARECARVRDDPKALARVVREMLAIITGFTVVVLGVFAACIMLVPRLSALAPLMWMFFVSTLLLSYGVEWYFQAVEEYEYITIRSVAFKLLSLIAILLFVRHSDDWLIYGAIVALAACGNNVFNITRLIHDVSPGGGARCRQSSQACEAACRLRGAVACSMRTMPRWLCISWLRGSRACAEWCPAQSSGYSYRGCRTT